MTDNLRELIAYKDRINGQMFRDSKHQLVIKKNWHGYIVMITGKEGINSYLGPFSRKVTMDPNPPSITLQSLKSMVEDGHLKRMRDHFDSKGEEQCKAEQ